MKDLQLDFENKTVINSFIDKKQRVSQQIRLAVNVWIEDWFLDETFGIDYQAAFRNQQLMENYVKAQILQVSGIKSIKSFTIQTVTNENDVYFQVDTILIYNGEVLEISEIIGN